MRRLLLELLHVMNNPLDAVEVVLDLGGLADQPAERLLDGDDVREDDAGLRGRDVEARADGEEGDGEREQDAHEVETDAEPALVRDREPVCAVLDVDALLVLVEEAVGFAVCADGGETREGFGEVAVQRRPK